MLPRRGLRFEPLGDSALLVLLHEAAPGAVAAAARRLAAAALPGATDVVAGFTSVAVHFDPLATGAEALRAAVRRALEGARPAGGGAARTVEIPVVYGGRRGPDLEALARARGLAPGEVAAIHAAGGYRVQTIGFLPGFPYLDGLDARLAAPRHSAPRPAVPAGSVGIGGGHTGVYPVESPGGWQIIGWTPLRLFDPAREPAALLRPGDRVRFRPVREAP